MESAVSSIGDHVDRTPLHQPAIMLTFAYLRRPPTTHMEIVVHRPAIILTCITSATSDYTHGDRRSSTGDHVDYNFSNLRLHTTGDHVDLCIPTATTDYTWRSPVHRFNDHRLRAHGDCRFIDRRLHPHGDRRFIDRRSC